ncbi:MAG: NlpC/P60 family protein [Candidatus Cryptobacteroides sp.]
MSKCSFCALCTILLMLLSIPAAARGPVKREMAITDLSANMIREVPDYAGELGDQALMGTVVEILDRDGYWVKIRTPEPYVGWVNEMGLAMKSEEEIDLWLSSPRYICTALLTHIYSEPYEGSAFVSDLVLGDILLKVLRENGKALGRKGFLAVETPSGKRGYVRQEELLDLEAWADERLETQENDPERFREDLVRTAGCFNGVPYMWGGTSTKNVDCSGLTRTVFFANGILLPRNASQQIRTGEDLPVPCTEGRADYSVLMPGDLIFWGRQASGEQPEKATHVGICVGGGRFIHSSQVVRTNDALSYPRLPLRGRRIVGQADKKGSGIISVRRSPYYFKQ